MAPALALDMLRPWVMNTNKRLDTNTLPLAVVHTRGRRVAWSTDPRWNPAEPAFGPDYERARANGDAGRSRQRAHVIVRDLLATARGVLVRGADSSRVVYVTRPPVGGSIRTAWSEAPALWWPTTSASVPSYEDARRAGQAGVGYGVQALQDVLEVVETPRTDTGKSGTQARAEAPEDAVKALSGLRIVG